MISGISIENFKGIRDRVEIEFRPITLLFGPNSAGKSTILHALHYAREIFERHNLDADLTLAGGRYVDLGGFRNFLHQGENSGTADNPQSGDDRGYGGHGDGTGTGVGNAYGEAFSDGHGFGDGGASQGSDRILRIGISIRLAGSGLPEYRDPDDYNTYDPQDLLFSGITQAHVEVGIAWSDRLNAPHVQEYTVSFNGAKFATITSQPGRRMPVLETVDLEHSVLVQRKDLDRFVTLESWAPDEADDGTYSGLKFLLNKVRRNAWVPVWQDGAVRILETLPQQADALPNWGRRLPLDSWRDDGVSNEPLDPTDREELESDNREINAVLSRLIVGPGELIRNALQNFRYLGPLRETPPRDFSPPRFPDPARWATGLGAWDELHTGSEEFVRSIGDWLGDDDKLDSGYRVERRHFKELALADPLIRKLLTGRAFDEVEQEARLNLNNIPTQTRVVLVPCDSDLPLRPHDVGIGISQVVPVVITALQSERRLLAIEQPELHLHPRLQARLADLFIEAALGKCQHCVVLETHSELIPLRLMRRIRETYDRDTTGSPAPVSSRDVAIYYIETFNGSTITTPLELGSQGQLLDPWPDGFFEEGFRERFAE